MSYDLMVFAPRAAPKGRVGFMAWYSTVVEWGEDHGYDDPGVCEASLASWFHDIRAEFPPMNGPFAPADNFDSPKVTDYSVGRQAIYAAFAWSQMRQARKVTFDLAKKHCLGFFDTSADDGQVWLPTLFGYRLAHGSGSSAAMPNPLG